MARWLLTGCAGFIGSNITRELLNNGEKVFGIDNFLLGHPDTIKPFREDKNFEFLEMDVNQIRTIPEKKFDYILHNAAIGSVPRSFDSPRSTLAANIMGTAAVFDFAKEVKPKACVYASSSSVHRMASPYAVSKKTTEDLARIYAKIAPETRFIGLRYFNVFGPGQAKAGVYTAVIPRWIEAIKGNGPVWINGQDAWQYTRDFTYVKDVVKANLIAAKETLPTGAIYEIGAGKPFTLQGLYMALKARLNPEHDRIEVMPPRSGDQKSSQVNKNMNLGFPWFPEFDLISGLTDWLGMPRGEKEDE